MKKYKFNKLYVVDAQDFFNLDTSIQNSLIFQGSKNWNFYLEKSCKESDIIKDATLLFFEKEDEFKKFISKNEIIDYSLEHLDDLKSFLVLV